MLCAKIFHHNIFVIIKKGRSAREHVINKRTLSSVGDYKAKPIRCLSITQAFDDLWSHVLRGSAKTIRLLVATVHNFGQSEVSDSGVTFCIKQYIFWFEISIDDASFVEIRDG